ncbi:MAG TPA: hypothetical protein VMJ72_00825 [Candidatus Paceibacterota bacterium]|nr:hypothetical protein [Candidatus Paceibacterota bacterium]
MSMEGPPTTPEKKEKLLTDERLVEAMKRGDLELVKDWYAIQEWIADQDPTGKSRTDLAIKMGTLQFGAGLTDFARDTFEAAREDAFQRYDDETVQRIQAVLDQLSVNG